jgi:hypothetical protein
MAYPVTTKLPPFSCKRGDDFFGGTLKFRIPDQETFDFTGFKAAIQLKNNIDSQIITYDFDPIPNVTTLGLMSIPLVIPHYITRNFLPVIHYGDVEIWRDSPKYPHHTVATFQIDFSKDISNPK